MHEALILSWIRRIPWGDFWEPVTTRQKWVKWTVILLVLSLGISIFLINLDELQDYEYALKNPVIVEAEKEIGEHFFQPYYEIYVSYSYDGVQYDHIYYDRISSSRNPAILWGGDDYIEIAVSPKNPGVPIKYMFNELPVLFAVILWSLGLTMLIYGTALEFPKFRQWRVSCANRPGFLSRPYGKPVKYTENPDYPKDFVLIFIPIVFISNIILAFSFPYTFSP